MNRFEISRRSVIRALLVCLLCLPTYRIAQAWTFELTEAELQARVDKRLPIEKKKPLFTVYIPAITVQLLDGSNRIDMLATMEFRSQHLSSGKGHARLDGRLTYQPAEGTFYLQAPVVRDVEFENIPDKYQPLLREVLQRAVQRRLANTPVYTLDEKQIKHQLAKTLLKSVRVEGGKLVLELGLL